MNDTPAESLLSLAIERENWELAALRIVVAAVEKVQALPPGATDAMLDLLDTEEPGAPAPRRRACRERRR